LVLGAEAQSVRREPGKMERQTEDDLGGIRREL